MTAGKVLKDLNEVLIWSSGSIPKMFDAAAREQNTDSEVPLHARLGENVHLVT
jgi:hypothetical protein